MRFKAEFVLSRMKESQTMSVRALVFWWILFATTSLSSAFPLPPVEELTALVDFANANGNLTSNGSSVANWNVGFDRQGNWTGGNPCQGFKGLRCWSSGNIRILSLPLSGLTGTLSPALGRLLVVTRLTLSQNNLSGDIGSAMAPLVNMKRLRLQGNQLTGTIEPWVRNMVALEELKLANNLIEGVIPAGLSANFSVLQALDLSNNLISGSIPDDLFRIPSLQKLALNQNNLSGFFPDSLASSTSASLNAVDLSENNLNGPLPTIWTTPNLTTLDLSRNNFSGPIPPQLLNLTTLKNFSLAENNFVGTIPVELSARFSCAAFLGNPKLVLQDVTCLKTEVDLPTSIPVSPHPPQVALGPKTSGAPPSKKDGNGLSTFAIVALTAGDIALLIVAGAAFAMFWVWWKKRDLECDKMGITGTGDSDGSKHSSMSLRKSDHYKDTFISTDGIQGGKSPFVTSAPVHIPLVPLRPALKSMVGANADPNSMDNRHRSSGENLSMDLSSVYSIDDFESDLVTLDGTLSLDFDDLLRATAVVLGTGSLGGVFVATLADGQMLLIKKLEEQVIASEEAFGKQCARLAGVLHPNLLQLRAYCWSQQEKLLVFDYMQHGSVHSNLHNTSGKHGENAKLLPLRSQEGKVHMDWSLRLKIAVGTARALAHLHDSDMVHGNIRASNVLIDDHMEPRLSDFGLETLLHNPKRHRKRRCTSEMEGAYLSPEQRLGTGGPYGTLAGDVYSFGVLLLELLTGIEPVGKNNMDLPTWVQEMTSINRTVELFDPALVSMHVLPAQDILEFLELAQACVSEDSSARPSITIVLRSLESIVPGSLAPRSFLQEDSSLDSYHET